LRFGRPAEAVRDTLRPMKPDIHKKASLTVIAIMLTVIAYNQYSGPKTTAQSHALILDPNTGEIKAVIGLRDHDGLRRK
jgi:hypothetical protein